MDKLYSYCCKKNKKIRYDSEEYEIWKEKYLTDFDSSYKTTGENKCGVKAHYIDPDGTYNSPDSAFFKDLEIFLNKQEQKKNDILNSHFNYRYVKGKGIEVKSNDKFLFYLRSDQLGFSAPSSNKNHPYDYYLIKSKDNNKYEKVAKWVFFTRTLGGSFLWPYAIWKNYNPKRGKEPYEDRADLALSEIKDLYKNLDYIKEFPNNHSILNNSRNRLLSCINDKNYKQFYDWFNHFKDFSAYTEFFCFRGNDNFVDDNNKINFFTDNEYNIPATKELKNIYLNGDIEDLTKIFDMSVSFIMKRSCNMQDIILK